MKALLGGSERVWLGCATVLALLLLASFGNVRAETVVSDAFEDGAINGSQWVTGGAKRGVWPYDPTGNGGWNYTIQEVQAADGYLQLHVWGPPSGNTYGAEAWVRTAYDFNDGRNYVVNFTWEARTDGHYDMYYIQVTDGFIPPIGGVHWPFAEALLPWWEFAQSVVEGTANFLYHTQSDGVFAGGSLEQGLAKSTWSMEIDASGLARLYDGPDGSGALLHESTLNPDKPWYLRLMVIDCSSGGFPGGDDSLLLYSFTARVKTLTVGIDIKPQTLNPRSRGRYVTAYIELSEGYDVADIDVGSVCLTVEGDETLVPAEAQPVAIGDYDNDGIPDLMVKFDRQAVASLLTPGETATVYVGGVLTDGTEFLGSDTLRVLGTVVSSSTLTFLAQVAQANEAACQTAQGLFDSLTSSRRGRGTSGEARRVLRLLDALLRRSPQGELGPALTEVRDALSDLAQHGVGPSGKIGISDVQLYSQAGYVAYCFAVLGDCYALERDAWLKVRRGLSSDFGLTEPYAALDVGDAQIALLSEAVDDFRTLAGALSDPQRAQQLTALADQAETLLLGLADYSAAERTYVDSW